jgi:phage/plasmid-like protein (TIGR03299 family)
MAHQLETWEDGSASFVTARQHAWHRLGTVLPAAFTAGQAMEHARLAKWNVRKVALQTVPVLDADGVTPALPVPEQFATVRTNPMFGTPDVLGVVGAGYTPIQNEAHADLLDSLVSQASARYETAGSLRGGRGVFLSMKLPDTMLIGGIDPVDLYLIALNSHDGTSAFRLMVSPVRVVCANTQALAIRRARSTFSIRHTSGAAGHIAEARQALGLTFKFVEAFQAEADRMIEQTITDAQFDDIIAQLWATDSHSPRSQAIQENRSLVLKQLLHESPTNESIRGSKWASVQVITEYLDHYAPTPTAKGNPALARAERVATSTALSAIKTRAFDLISAL